MAIYSTGMAGNFLLIVVAAIIALEIPYVVIGVVINIWQWFV
jgi:hypothetical protein